MAQVTILEKEESTIHQNLLQSHRRKNGKGFKIPPFSNHLITNQRMKRQLLIDNTPIAIAENGYVSLTDLAKSKTDRPETMIACWMKSQATLSYLKAWEETNNADFKNHETLDFKGWEQLVTELLNTRFVMSPQKWIAYTNGIGLELIDGETWAAESIALTFAAWIDPAYQLELETALQEYKNSIKALLDERLNYN